MRSSGLIAFLFTSTVLAACSDDEPSPRPPAPDGGGGAPEAGPPPDAGDEDVSLPPPAEASAPETGPEAAPPDAEPPWTTYPPLLSQTGLYADLKTETLADGVRAYEPRYALWSDGASKRRFFRLPPGAKIDTSDMDFWTYPVGTKAWKEFTRDGKRIETRLLLKPDADPLSWIMISYLWREDGSDADAVPEGAVDALGTDHDVPAEADCDFCHKGVKDRLLGVSAIQLSHEEPGMSLQTLIADGLLTDPPAGPFRLPGPPVAEQAMGYLHANCGLCHNRTSPVFVTVAVEFWQTTDALGSVEATPAYRTTVRKENAFWPDLHIIEPGRPGRSELFLRMNERGPAQMPPVATELVDSDGVAKVRAWIESMPVVDGGAGDGGAGDGGRADSGVE